MTLKNRIKAFAELGVFLKNIAYNNVANLSDCEKIYFDIFMQQIDKAHQFNGWFTRENVLFAIRDWVHALTEENLIQWTSAYHFADKQSKTVGLVTAGNIPLVGMHDFISVLISGHKVLVKQSSNDQKLLPVLADFLVCNNPEFGQFIKFTEGKLTDFDAIIATGSNNTSRYFEAYFKNVPHIIRKNRNAVAVLMGNETPDELEALGTDIFQYFGLGCRSVSKLFVPKNYDFDKLFRAIYKHKDIINHHKYKNNYDYNKTIYLMNQTPLLENGFVVLKEDLGYASPISVLYYEYYDTIERLKTKLKADIDEIQCVVNNGFILESVNFGQSQHPHLWDYADGIDTLDFLIDL